MYVLDFVIITHDTVKGNREKKRKKHDLGANFGNSEINFSINF